MKKYTKQKFKKLFPWFYAIEKGLKAPISFFLLPTDKCFCKCNMCTHWKMKEKKELDYETVKSILVEAQKNGSQSVSLSGGDIFAWKHVERLFCDKSITLDFQVTTPLIFPIKFDLSLLKRIKWLRISFDAIDNNTYKEIRGVNKVHRVIENIRNIINNNLIKDIGIATVLQKKNLNQIDVLADFIKSYEIKRWIVHPVDFNPDLSLDTQTIHDVFRYLVEKYSKSIPINNWDVYLKENNEYEKANDLPCYIAKMKAFIDASLRIWPCCNLAMDSRGDEERAEHLMMGRLKPGRYAGLRFIKIWQNKRNYLDKFNSFKDIHPLCKSNCRFKYFYYNLGYHYCKQRLSTIYL